MFSRRSDPSLTEWWLIYASAHPRARTSPTIVFSTLARLLSTRLNSAITPFSAKEARTMRSLLAHFPFQCSTYS